MLDSRDLELVEGAMNLIAERLNRGIFPIKQRIQVIPLYFCIYIFILEFLVNVLLK